MKTLLTKLEELEGKTIHSIEIDGGYSSDIIITTTEDEVLIISVSGNWDRCGDYEGTEVEIRNNNDLGYYDKSRYDLLTEEDIFNHQVEEEKKNLERKKREEEEKRKAKEAEDKVRKSELELLEKLKNKYEK